MRHEAHVHGVAELTLALEGEYLELMLTSAAMSIVGFEHRASAPEQARAVADAETTLRNASEVFNFTGTRCSPSSVLVDMSAVMEAGTHEEHGEHQESHTDISARYKYNCDDTADLQSLRFGAGTLPFLLEKINVMWVSDRGQGATVLTADNQTIEFN